MDKSELALLEMAWRNPIRNDGDAYELALVLWGLGLLDEKPNADDFSQYGIDSVSEEKLLDYARELATHHNED